MRVSLSWNCMDDVCSACDGVWMGRCTYVLGDTEHCVCTHVLQLHTRQ